MKIIHMTLLLSASLLLMGNQALAMLPVEEYEEETSQPNSQPNAPRNGEEQNWSTEDKKDEKDEKPDIRPSHMQDFRKTLMSLMELGPVPVPPGVLDAKAVVVKIPCETTEAQEEKLYGRGSGNAPVLTKQDEDLLPPVPARDPDKDDANLMTEENGDANRPQAPIRDEHLPSSLQLRDQAEQAEALRLAELILKNLHGPLLEVDAHNYSTVMDGICLSALCQTKTIRKLSLATFLEDETLMTLCHLLTKNTSIRTLDLSKSNLKGKALNHLGYALEKQRTLRTIIFPIKADFKAEDVARFYAQIAQNSGLRLITWPNHPKILIALKELAGDKSSKLKSSREPNKHAALHLGIMYREGIMGHVDEKEALKYLMIAYKANHPQAAYAIGKLHERKKDFNQAIIWYERAKHFTCSKALAKLGNYQRGIWPKGSNREPMYEAAFILYQEGANLGDRECLYRLGRMYEAGRHVDKDLNMAGALFYKALENGYADAIVALGALYNNPDFISYDQNNSKLYLEWAKKFQKIAATAEKHLTYIGKTGSSDFEVGL